jgi:hypothetical protein
VSSRGPPISLAELSPFIIQPYGQTGKFTGIEWDRDLGPAVRAWLRPVGGLAQGDCGPASGYGLWKGAIATEREASDMRARVFMWSTTLEGQVYYARCLAATHLHANPLEEMQEDWQRDGVWVTPEFFTVLGGMLRLNIFMLMRTINADGTTNCGISLRTNGGTLVKTDSEDCCCVYYQSRLRNRIGHFEFVRDKNGKRLWKADDQIVQGCLWPAMIKAQVVQSVRDMRRKMLVAATNRINSVNETFQVGDCAWLTVPEEVVDRVMTRLRNKRDKLAVKEAKLLVRVVRILSQQPDADHSTLPTHQFIVCTEDGIVESTFSIDQLQRCHPPPDPNVYRVVEYDITAIEREAATGSKGRAKKPNKLSKAYRRFITLQSTRQSIAVHAARQKKATEHDASPSPDMTLDYPADSAAHLPPPDVLPDSTLSAPLTPPRPSAAPKRKAEVLSLSSDSDAMSDEDANEDGKRVDCIPYPCVHCGMTLSWKEYSLCMFLPCQVPFHKLHSGCANGHRVHIVDKVMAYCSLSCASRDQSGGVTASLSESQPTAASHSASDLPKSLSSTTASASSATPPVDRDASFALSQPTTLPSYEKAALVCTSCLKPLQWNKSVGCALCYGYHHKVRRGKEGCTREGWEKGGSRNVDGNVSCVECRFKRDLDWIRFQAENKQEVRAE